MAVSLTITVTDAQAARVQTACGHFDNSLPPVWILATAADVRAILLNDLKNRVTEYETAQAAKVQRATNDAEVWTGV